MSKILQARVTEVRPGGIVVNILFNARKGFIRWRELSWDRRIGFRPQSPRVGDLIEAVIIEETIVDGHFVPLSLRRVSDPWQRPIVKYKRGLAVRGEIVNVRQVGVFIQLEPGIDAYLAPTSLPLLPDQTIESALAIGDQVDATIIHVDLQKRQIELSITQRLIELSQMSIEQRKAVQLAHFKHPVLPSPVTTANTAKVHNLHPKAPSQTRYHSPLPNVENVLVIDDNEESLLETIELLEQQFQLSTTAVFSSDEAIEHIQNNTDYQLALIDVHLDNETGVFAAQRLLGEMPQLEIIFISSVALADQDLPPIMGRNFLFASKQPQEIIGVIEKVLEGYYEEQATVSSGVLAQDQNLFVRQLGMDAAAGEPLSDTLARMISKLRRESQSTYALLIEADPRVQSAWIVAIDPPLTREIRLRSEDGLYYSPARNVAEDKEEFYRVLEQDGDEERSRELQYFLPLLDFQTCLGLPLHTSASVVGHGLFLLHKQARRYSTRKLNEISVAIQQMQWAIERSNMLDYMRRYEQRYTLGFLLSSLVHEVSNKLDGLSALTVTLKALLDEIRQANALENQQVRMVKVGEISDDILEVKQTLVELLTSYSRAASDSMEAVDVIAIAHKVKQQFSTYAREESVAIEIEATAGPPLAHTIQTRLEQVLTNIVLNAIQQISRQRSALMQSTSSMGTKGILLRNDLILIQVQLVKANDPFPLRITVLDTGPGIHHAQREEIFLMDTSMRQEGHGLGLFISRSLVETMGGRLRLADSILFVGSAFVIELPLVPNTEDELV